jgi:sulfoxide reductase heme-binding subunit YedZ
MTGIIMKNLFKRFTPLQIAMHMYAWSVLVMLIYQFFTHHLSADPVQYLERRTGHHAIALLILSLACTPLNTLFKWSELLKRRRALGLYAFMYVTIHILIYLDLDFGLAWSFILQNFTQDPRLIVGLTAFLLLIPLAWTSFDIWKKRLKKNWKRLHKVVYAIVPLAVLHFAWNKKGDIFTLQGDIAQPLAYALIVIILLILRIPPVRKAIASLRDRVIGLFRRQRALHQVSS